MTRNRAFLVATAISWALGSTQAWAENKYTVSLRQNVTDAVAVYHGNGGPLEQVSDHRQVRTSVRGDGVFAAINKDKQAIDETVIGIDYSGHSRISIVNQGGRTYLHVDGLFDDTVDGVQVRLETNYLAEVEFLQGSWEEYEAGRDVTLRLTQEGQKTSMEAASAALKRVLHRVKKTFESQLAGAGAKFSEIKLDSLNAEGRGAIRGNKNRLTVESAPSEIQVSFTILASF